MGLGVSQRELQLGLVTEQIWARCSLLEARCLEKRNNSCEMTVEERFRHFLTCK